ncbi:ABC transporter permease [Pseudobutyrivibrio xylanivorans]|uniref:Putative ABC transport system permease protein n=1 Tax=Pseudobutyrivibrio xylanivorans DSM 14809 TaxID=1123012 RepID=A0A1M6CMA3_PSEXY|nr:ABC transporter permease [Pseudobutyrivibrio xylanivorans]SHI62053.1 putative ABC transport system permease protein [Pseudobutyrivibrio xylanivorans DSM 14809]
MLALSTFREIKQSLGRYIALLMIIAIGVGFFAGLKVTDPALRASMQQYFEDNEFYDFRLISSLGFGEDEIEYIKNNIDARYVEESIAFDVMMSYADSEYAMKIISLPTNINKVVLMEGTWPKYENECLVDAAAFDEIHVGDTIKVADGNEKEDRDRFKYSSFKIVGIAKSPLYIQYERGTTSIGTGVLDGFLYVKNEAFKDDIYTDCYVKLDSDPPIYSDEYDKLIESKEDAVQAVLDKAAEDRYAGIIKEAQDKMDDAREELEEKKASTGKEFDDAKAELDSAKKKINSGKKQIEEYESLEAQLKDGLDQMLSGINQMEMARSVNPAMFDENQYNALMAEYQEKSAQLYTLQSGLEKARKEYNSGKKEYEDGLAEYEDGVKEFDEKIAEAEDEIADAQKEIDDIEEADTYLLKRDGNAGYVCFESDSTIVGAIGNVFPIFFFLVAALVCMTTMNRMVEDQRTQIGVLKALGYSNGAIMGKFAFYSGSAAFVGTLLGFFLGTFGFPQAIWYAYQMMYNTRGVDYYFDPVMLVICFVVAFICSVGVTLVSCRVEMTEMAASLMRPKAPKAGKRIFLEYIPFFWNRLKFLRKVSLRNIFRYKGRLIMMVMGIGGCTALLVAGFGVYDSIADIAENQYTNISLYDMDITLKKGSKVPVHVLEKNGYDTEDYILFYHSSVDLKFGKHTKNIYMNVYDDGADIDKFFDIHDVKGNHIDMESLGDDEIVLNMGICDRFDIKKGDKVTISSEDMKPVTLTIGAINQNFINNYMYMNASTYEKNIGPIPEKKNLFVVVDEGIDSHEAGAALMGDNAISIVQPTQDMLDRVENMMGSLNIIIYLVIGSAMALAAVVVYNLTNINISERVREIATVKVLGFYKEETRSYVFRENILLAIMGAAVGLVLGKFFHAFIMSQIIVDLITFDVRVTPLSYVLSFVLTVIFTLVINVLMGPKLDEISMTESLKAVE